MIPVSLEARNFMAYEHLALDFTPFQIACLSGPNGSGKSSILDALTWALFEKSRASHSEDVIRLGAQEAQVQFSFELEGQLYRILRSKQRGSGKSSGKSSLEFQVQSENGFRSLSAKSVTKTQQEIIQTLHMDYGLFINSSFILQGRADVFTTSTATQRKEVLADILNLKQYDLLQERAKNKRSQVLLEKQQVQGQLQQIETLLQSEPFLKDQHLSLTEQYHGLNETLQAEKALFSQLETENQALKQTQIRLEHQQQRFQQVQLEQEKKNQDRLNLQQEQAKIQKLRDQADAITQGYAHLQELIKKQDQLDERYAQYLQCQDRLRTAQSQWQQWQFQADKEKQAAEHALSALEKEHAQCLKLIAQTEQIESAWQALQRCQQDVTRWEEKAKVFRGLEKESWLQSQTLAQLKAEKTAEVQRLQSLLAKDEEALSQEEALAQKQAELEQTLQALEQLQLELDEVTLQGQNCKYQSSHFAEKKQEILEKQAASLQKSRNLESQCEDHCPLCERRLSPEDIDLLLQKYRADQAQYAQALQDLEQRLAENEAAAEQYRQRYKQLARELKRKESLQQQLGQTQLALEQLQGLKREYAERKQAWALASNWEQSETWQAAQARAQALQAELTALAYDPEAHQAAQADLVKWKAAEFQYQELLAAQSRNQALLPQLQAAQEKRQALSVPLEAQPQMQHQVQPLLQQIKDLEAQLSAWAQLPTELQANKAELMRLRVYQQRWESLKASQETWEQLQKQALTLAEDLSRLEQEGQRLQAELAEWPLIQAKLAANETRLAPLTAHLRDSETRERELHAQIFSLEKELNAIAEQKVQWQAQQSQFAHLENESRLYSELVELFGPKGLQAVVIENALPEIEQAANDLLSQMTEGRMHLKFQTLKSLKSREGLSETLDIFISDELGTRSYETFSAGEAFRVNFAIRLAISRMLARRAGAKLQTLVIDEGFGSQDTQGKSRLVEAINAVAHLYACILVITHVDDLKALFPTRIEVQKLPEGSRIRLEQ